MCLGGSAYYYPRTSSVTFVLLYRYNHSIIVRIRVLDVLTNFQRKQLGGGLVEVQLGFQPLEPCLPLRPELCSCGSATMQSKANGARVGLTSEIQKARGGEQEVYAPAGVGLEDGEAGAGGAGADEGLAEAVATAVRVALVSVVAPDGAGPGFAAPRLAPPS